MLKLPKKSSITNDKIGKDYTIITNIESKNKITYIPKQWDEGQLAYLKASCELTFVWK